MLNKRYKYTLALKGGEVFTYTGLSEFSGEQVIIHQYGKRLVGVGASIIVSHHFMWKDVENYAVEELPA